MVFKSFYSGHGNKLIVRKCIKSDIGYFADRHVFTLKVFDSSLDILSLFTNCDKFYIILRFFDKLCI